MPTRYELVSSTVVGEHIYECYDVVADEDLIDDVARIVAELYVDPESLMASLRRASADLETVASASELTTLMGEVAAAVIPQMDLGGERVHLQTPRNEVAEILAFDVLRQIHKALIPASRIREKEISRAPTRGLDIFALLTTPKVRAVICEVKASSSSASPPPVVGSGDDSMHAQTKKRLKDRHGLLAELNWAHKHTTANLRGDVAKALILLSRKDAEPPVAAPVLVRPMDKYGADDFGCFKEAPEEYSPAQVRFSIIRIPGTLEDFAERVYARAREVA
ncbi:hypothetical protein ACH4NS_08245 [Streptomyces mutabilis]|uniref:hypothetical protein n=1 Tax=Streptomyces mutabilis TaxID=67332 RepID=UPI00379B8D36